MKKSNIRKNSITKTEMVAISNAITNESELYRVSVNVQKDVPKYKNEPFTIVFQIANSLLIKDMELIECKVLLYLISKAEYGNVIDRTIKEIAEEIGYKDSNYIQKTLKKLEAKNIVLRSTHPHDKRRFIYMLNPKQSWKGNVKDRKKTIGFFSPNQLQMSFSDPVKETQKQSRALPNNFTLLNKNLDFDNEKP